MYFHSFRSPGLIVDIVQDIKAMNGEAVHASSRKTGIIVLGGELPKHHICNANMMGNGADYAVFINTAQEFDGSDSRARLMRLYHGEKFVDLPKLSRYIVTQLLLFPYWLLKHLHNRGEMDISRLRLNAIFI